MFAMELSASRDCAREIRGTESIAITVTPRAASFSISSGFWAGQTKLTSVVPRVQQFNFTLFRCVDLQNDG
ncbi:hypothetical protein HR12_32620 [Microbacterium sp. SUBG005]|nr:hypothetical protein HR12_32620 [Microbacterium sp. SUBG005]